MIKFADLNFTIKNNGKTEVTYLNKSNNTQETVTIEGVSPIILKHLRLLSKGNIIESPSLQMAIVDSSDIDSEYSQTTIIKSSQSTNNIIALLKAKGKGNSQKVNIEDIVIKSLNGEPVKEGSKDGEKFTLNVKDLVNSITNELTKAKNPEPTLAGNIQKLKDLKNK